MNGNTAESNRMPPEGGGKTVRRDKTDKTYSTYMSCPADPELELR